MPTFHELWNAYPSNQPPPPPNNIPCSTNGSSNFSNQCVIRLGEAMTACGINLASYKGTFCWHNHGKKHPLRVEQMKLWLNSPDATFVGYADVSKRIKGAQKSYHFYFGKKGIVAYLNFHGLGNQGDHIDLWDGLNSASGGRDYFHRSEEIWFWELS